MLLQAAVSIPGWAGPAGNSDQADAAKASNASKSSTEELGLGLMGVRADRIGQEGTNRYGGMSGYLLAFEIISIHLVVVLIGAAYLARAKRRPGQRSKPMADEDSPQTLPYRART
jgi:NADH-quinone oxidoreductase subunit J